MPLPFEHVVNEVLTHVVQVISLTTLIVIGGTTGRIIQTSSIVRRDEREHTTVASDRG